MAVRRERVILELEDQFTGPLGRAAAATKAFEKSLGDLDRTSVRADRGQTSLGDSTNEYGIEAAIAKEKASRLNKELRDQARAAVDAEQGIDRVGVASRNSDREIDRFSGRLRLLADTAAILGPALVPIGAVAIPAVTGLAAQFGAAAIASGTALIAFQGVGDTLDAVNKAALEPTAANIEAARIAMQNLAPEAAAFVRQLQEMRPAFDALQEAAAAGIFPGLSAALTEAEGSFDTIERVLYAVGDAAGDLAEDFAQGLAGPRGQEFLAFIEGEVPGALTELGHTVGNLVAGMAEMWMAFTPLNNDFSGWLLDISRSFDDWAAGLAQTQGFRDFVAYIRESGPQVADAMGSLGNALLQIVEAAAPLGGPVLAGLTAVADVLAAIASSPAGPTIMTAVTALALLNRGLATVAAVKGSALFTAIGSSADDAGRKISTMQRATVGVGAALAGLTILDEVMNSTDKAAAGVEGMTRALLDFQGAATVPDELGTMAESIERLLNPTWGDNADDVFRDKVPFLGDTKELKEAKVDIDALDAALANVASTQGIAASESLFTGLGEDLGLTSAELDKLAMERLPQYREAIAAAQNETGEFGRAGREAGADAAGGFNKAESAAERFRIAIERANAALEGRASMRDYQQAIDDMRKSIRDNGRTLDINTQKGRDNQAALDGIVSTALKVSETMRGSNKVEFLRNARGDFVDATAKLVGGREAAQRLWDRLVQLDKARANPKVDVDTGSAQAKMEQVAATLRNLNGSRAYTQVITEYKVVRSSSDAIAPRGRGMAGGEAWGGEFQRAASGEMVPKTGLGYADRHPYLLADGEHVVTNRNGEADRNRAALEAANRGATLAIVSGMATGGRAGSVNVAAPNVNVGAPGVRVFIDGREVRAIVRAEQSADREFERQMSRG